LLTLFILTCDQSIDSSLDSSNDLKGVWLLYEEGYSPGAGYVTRPVPPDPAQTLKFIDESQIVSSVKGYEEFKFYTVERDSTNKMISLKIFRTDPHTEIISDSAFRQFIVEKQEETMKLMQIGCIEGCHLGFVRKMEPAE
jgi:hypothetical protein